MTEVRAVPTAVFTVEGEGPRHLLYVLYPERGKIGEAISLEEWKPSDAVREGIGARLSFSDGRACRVYLPIEGDPIFHIE